MHAYSHDCTLNTNALNIAMEWFVFVFRMWKMPGSILETETQLWWLSFPCTFWVPQYTRVGHFLIKLHLHILKS